MEKTLKKEFYWRKLDSQAKVFSLASNNKYSSIFRLSVLLNEEIECEILQNALELTLKKYEAYKVKMSRGLFWYYLEENTKLPIVSEENGELFRKINTKSNNDYLFKVTYFKNKINIDFFHVLTDGNSGIEFLKDVVYRYLEIKYSNKIKENKLNELIVLKDSENAYVKNYKKNISHNDLAQKAYMIKGEKLPEGKIGINHFNIDLNDLKLCSKEKLCSLSMYIVAMIGYSIYEANYKKNNGKYPINLCIPINLKKYFPTTTLSNFFSYMMISLKLKRNKEYSFEDILDIVKKEFEKKLKQEKILATMSSIVDSTNNPFIRGVPLFCKKAIVRIGSLEVKRHFTMTISNIGIINIDKEYSEYIESFFTILSPDWAERMKCGICSYKNKLVVTLGTVLNNNMIETQFKKILEKNNIHFNIEGNGINVVSK